MANEADVAADIDEGRGAVTVDQKERACNVWLIRHGEKGLHPGVDWQWPLSSHGQDQAREVAANLAAVFSNLDTKPQILVSPFLRTVQTVAATAQLLGIPARLEPGLGEAKQGENVRSIHPANERLTQLAQCDSSLQLGCYDDSYEALVIPAIPESAEQYTARVLEIAKILKEMSGAQDLIVVTHASLVTGITVALTGQPLDQIGPDGKVNETCIMQLQGGNSGPWQVVQNGSTAHLSKLGNEAYIPKRSNTWIDFVRKHGNGPFV